MAGHYCIAFKLFLSDLNVYPDFEEVEYDLFCFGSKPDANVTGLYPWLIYDVAFELPCNVPDMTKFHENFGRLIFGANEITVASFLISFFYQFQGIHNRCGCNAIKTISCPLHAGHQRQQLRELFFKIRQDFPDGVSVTTTFSIFTFLFLNPEEDLCNPSPQ